VRASDEAPDSAHRSSSTSRASADRCASGSARISASVQW
jgi:hypothetical protein